MFALAIAAVIGSPIVILAIGFLGVSRKRAEDGRAHIVSPLSAASTSFAAKEIAKETPEQPVHNTAQPAF